MVEMTAQNCCATCAHRRTARLQFCPRCFDLHKDLRSVLLTRDVLSYVTAYAVAPYYASQAGTVPLSMPACAQQGIQIVLSSPQRLAKLWIVQQCSVACVSCHTSVQQYKAQQVQWPTILEDAYVLVG